MKIQETRVMRGPNQWSGTQKTLIVLKVHAEEIQQQDFEDLMAENPVIFPDFQEVQHSNQAPPVVQLMQYLACSLQNRAGMPCTYTRVKSTGKPDEYFIIFSYEIEQAGVHAGRAAVEILKTLFAKKSYDVIPEIEELRRLKSKHNIGPTSNYLLDEIKRRGFPYRQFDYGSLITVGYGCRQKKIRTAVTDSTSGLGIEMAGDKEETKKILAQANCPVPKGIVVSSEKELRERIGAVAFPLAIKPLDGNHGRGVTTNVSTIERAVYAYEIASRISGNVIVEEFIEGDDYRFLVINYKLVAVAKRTPAYVTGDGKSTIQELIDAENLHSDRGNTYEHVLAKISIDGTTKKILAQKELTLESVLPQGERLVLKGTANISAGGTAEDVTDEVHPANVFMVERIAKLFNLNICGVDIMANAIDVPITRETGAIIEVNAGPGLRMHSNPQKGKARDIASPIVDMLFPDPTHARIPIIAVTGTNGKTTTTRLIAHLAGEAGHTPGFCTTDGIYINGHLLYKGDCTGRVSAQSVLFDPSIDMAVLECARGGIIRSGLGFDECDIAVITNITEDHLGLKDIHTVEDLAKVKRVVAQSVKKDGYAILNADDERVYGIFEELQCKIALFSLDPENERIHTHVKNGGVAATIENNYITILNHNKIIIEDIQKIPLSFDGRAEFMVGNILAATLAGFLSGFNTSAIKNGLLSFIPSPELTPGRMNLFDFDHFKLMVDYAHNTDGFIQVKKFLSQVEESPKTGIIAVAGDRRPTDIMAVGSLVADMFDTVIIRHNKDARGVGENYVSDLLKEGIKKINPSMKVISIPDERDALEYAIQHAEKGSFIFACADKVQLTLEYVNEFYDNRHHLGTAI